MLKSLKLLLHRYNISSLEKFLHSTVRIQLLSCLYSDQGCAFEAHCPNVPLLCFAAYFQNLLDCMTWMPSGKKLNQKV